MKVCIVGCGVIGTLHAKNLSKQTALSFCSRSRSSAEKLQRRFGGVVFDRYQDALKSDVDAVVLATPPDVHAEQIVAALGAGKCVLAEKPMCAREAEVALIGEAVQAADSFLMVGENYYYKAALRHIKKSIAAGAIGALQSLRAKKLTTQAAIGWKSKYGALLEGGVHFIALISDIVGHAPVKVNGEFPGAEAGEPERHSRTRLEYEGGVTAELEYSWSTPSVTKGVFQHSHIAGETGRIAFESNGLYVWTRAAHSPWKLKVPWCQDLLGYKEMMLEFVQCLEDRRRTPYSDFDKAKRELSIVFAAYEHLP